MHANEMEEMRTVILLQLLSRQIKSGRSFEEACRILMLTEEEILLCRKAMKNHSRHLEGAA
ncbi:MAG: hypothetical protein K6G61_07120 [Solobacterium sp.]|nr:hypothetical protein [Solobacterium sp.]